MTTGIRHPLLTTWQPCAPDWCWMSICRWSCSVTGVYCSLSSGLMLKTNSLVYCLTPALAVCMHFKSIAKHTYRPFSISNTTQAYRRLEYPPLQKIGFTFLVPVHPCSPGQRVVKQLLLLLFLVDHKFFDWLLNICSFQMPNLIRPVTLNCDLNYQMCPR